MPCVTPVSSAATTVQNSIENPDKVLNHNCNKIVKSDWLSTAPISALIGQFNRTVRAITRA